MLAIYVITRFIRVIQYDVKAALDCRDKPGNDRSEKRSYYTLSTPAWDKVFYPHDQNIFVSPRKFHLKLSGVYRAYGLNIMGPG